MARGERVLRLRHGDQMNVIGHQAIGPDRNPTLSTPLDHQLDIGRVVLVEEKRLLPTIPTLGYVMRQTRNDQSR